MRTAHSDIQFYVRQCSVCGCMYAAPADCPGCTFDTMKKKIEQLRVERNGAIEAGLELEAKNTRLIERWNALDRHANEMCEVHDGAGDYLRVVKADIESELPYPPLVPEVEE